MKSTELSFGLRAHTMAFMPSHIMCPPMIII